MYNELYGLVKATKDKLILNNKIEIRKSSIHGYGVFANDDIKKDEILEECHWIEVDPKINAPRTSLDKYKFAFPKQYQGNNKWNGNVTPGVDYTGALALGYAMMYNSSDVEEESNADWVTDEDTNLFVFSAIKDIKKDEEILLYYSYTFDQGHYGYTKDWDRSDEITWTEWLYNGMNCVGSGVVENEHSVYHPDIGKPLSSD